MLLEAFCRLPVGTASVTIVGEFAPYHGDSSYSAVLEPLLRLDGVRVREPIPHGRIAVALSEIDVLVIPSVWPENSPLVLQEAFLAGVPVIASRIGGIPEMLPDGRGGLLFKPGSADDLATAISRLAADRGLLDALRASIPRVQAIEEDVAGSKFALHVSPLSRVRG